MFSWLEFSTVARECADALCRHDHRLAAILSAPQPIGEQTDEIGKPLPESVGVHQHPDVANFKRVISVRRATAEETAQPDYVAYANRTLAFLNTLGAGDDLYLVQVTTNLGSYEFLFCPRRGIAAVSDVTGLVKP